MGSGLNTKLGLLFFLILGLIHTGFGAEQEDTLKTYRMPVIVVTATRSEKAVKDLSATVSVITREEIEAANANSSTEILSRLPGLFVERTGAFGRADVDIRGIGGAGRQLMVLVDGRPVKMGLFGCTITHSLPLDNVERIEVVRGPLSVLYGSDALGGVVNIITRQVKNGFDTDFTTSYGSHHTRGYRLRQGANLGNLDYYLTIDRRQSDGFLPHSAYKGSDFTARLGYLLTGNLKAILRGKYFDGHKEEPLRATDPDTMVSQTWNDYKRGAVDLTLTGKWNKWNGQLKVYRNFGENRFSNGWHSRDFTNGAVLNGSGKVIPTNELTLGAEFREQGGERLHKLFPWEKEGGKFRKSEYALYLHDEQILWGKLILTSGGRINHDEISGNEFCPQVGIVFHPRRGTTIRGAVNKGFRSPQISELFLFRSSNSHLKPERVWDYELGFNQKLIKGIDFDLVGYLMRGENMIQTEMSKWENSGEFRFKGVETGIAGNVGKGFYGRLYYTYLDAGQKTKGRPGNKIDLTLNYRRKVWGFSLVGQYVSRYFAADSSREPIGDYLVLNTALNYRLISGLSAFFAIDNILNRGYEIYADIPGGQAGLYAMPKRSFTLGFKFNL